MCNYNNLWMSIHKFKTYFLIVLTFTLFHLTNQIFKVYRPACAQERHKIPIQYLLGNFGHIPYETELKGHLVKPNNKSFCDMTNEGPVVPQTQSKFLLVERGQCKFTKKIIEAQKKKYKMVIIYDNITSEHPTIVMANDGYGHLVEIPAIFISRKDGLALIQTMQTCKSNVTTIIKFETNKREKADVTLWLDIYNRQSFIVLRDFYRDYYNSIAKFMSLNIKFKVQQRCFDCPVTDCLIQSQNICYKIEQNPQKLNGKQILYQVQRSYWTYQINKDKPEIWWKYMLQFDQKICLDKKDIKECSQTAMQVAGANPKFVSAEIMNDQNHNILRSFAKQAKSQSILFYPQAIVNNIPFYGIFKSPQLFDMICKSLKQQPCECDKKCQQPVIPKKNQSHWYIFFIIIGFIIGTLSILATYRMYVQRRTNQLMSVEVNRMVEQYVNLTETNSSNVMPKRKN